MNHGLAPLRRSAAVAGLALILVPGMCAWLAHLLRPSEPEVVIYAGEAWYRERPEPEEIWHGVLEARTPGLGPNNRTALSFALVMADGELPVYAAGVEERLGQFEGRAVSVTGKRIDLTAEGFGPELWIGRLRPEETPDGG